MRAFRSFIGFGLSGLLLVSFTSLTSCDDEDGGRKATPGSGGSGGSGGGDAGPDKGPFGERVPITETRAVTGLSAPVNAVRDKYGMVHIYARTIEDAVRVEGYMMAADRAPQLEIARRLAEGRIAELLGGADPGQIDSDITMRTIGLGRAAQKIYDAMDPSSTERKALDAFADGITQYNRMLREGKQQLPQKFPGLPNTAFTDWSPVDSLAMARLQTWSLSYDADDDISRTEKVEKMRATFNAGAASPDLTKRAGILLDAFRWDPIVPATPLTKYPDDPLQKDVFVQTPSALHGLVHTSLQAAKSKKTSVQIPLATLGASTAFRRAVGRARDFFGGDEFFGSNNWAVAKDKTTSGHAMVASDPHLGLSAPMVFWPAHLVVDDGKGGDKLELIGVAFPGIPGVVLGSNRTLGWGATTSGFDVTDVWKETVSADAKGVTFKGQPVAFEKISETLKIDGQPDYTWDVLVVPHHGPIVPTITDTHQVTPPAAGESALSVRWTGHQPSGEYEAVFALAQAKDVDAARLALQPFGTGAQNWMFADSNGDIFEYSASKLPYRDKKAFTWDPATFTGTMPMFVLDGASGDHEWTGEFLEEQYVPHEKNPAAGWLATANTDAVGSTLDNDPTNDLLPNGKPFYIGGDFSEGFRLGRIQERLKAKVGSMTAEEMASIQGDHKSGLGTRLTKHLVTALTNAEAEKATPGSKPGLTAVVADPRYAAAKVPELLTLLGQWETESQFAASAGVNLDDGSPNVDAKEATAAEATAIFNAWLVRAIGRALEDEMTAADIDNLGTANMVKGFVRMLEVDPTKLATYDAVTGESSLWDDLATQGVTETKDERLVMALLDGLDDLGKLLGADRNAWRWGALHRVRFKSLNPLWFIDIPSDTDPKFGQGFPRHGDQWNVDACNFGIVKKLADPLDFKYGSGPVQRFVAEMTADGPKIKNGLPGGAVVDKKSPYFANEAEYWRKNESHDVPFDIDDVATAAGGGQHILFTP